MHDWMILVILVVIEVILFVIHPFYRFVGKDMMDDLKYPMKDNTVPVWAVPVSSTPFVSQGIVQFSLPKFPCSSCFGYGTWPLKDKNLCFNWNRDKNYLFSLIVIVFVLWKMLGLIFLVFDDQMYAVLLPIVVFLLIYPRRRDVYDLHHAVLGNKLNILLVCCQTYIFFLILTLHILSRH